jgi:isocitrate dehydrogenase kinase/phosphatase
VTGCGKIDEMEYMTDCKFRKIPPSPNIWYSETRNDVFPEAFAAFLSTSEKLRSLFMRDHKDIRAGF